mmetsp:Transcript_2306/g.7301  ORF Transcript_2306/g.7301 Transcript_2306/m.7301 type:complete len:424 (+) Transcript_2306:1426-2697(+)
MFTGTSHDAPWKNSSQTHTSGPEHHPCPEQSATLLQSAYRQLGATKPSLHAQKFGPIHVPPAPTSLQPYGVEKSRLGRAPSHEKDEQPTPPSGMVEGAQPFAHTHASPASSQLPWKLQSPADAHRAGGGGGGTKNTGGGGAGGARHSMHWPDTHCWSDPAQPKGEPSAQPAVIDLHEPSASHCWHTPVPHCWPVSGRQRPAVADVFVHVLHRPALPSVPAPHSSLQHTESTQKLDWHCEPVTHASPSALSAPTGWTHEPVSSHAVPAGQSRLPEVKQMSAKDETADTGWPGRHVPGRTQPTEPHATWLRLNCSGTSLHSVMHEPVPSQWPDVDRAYRMHALSTKPARRLSHTTAGQSDRASSTKHTSFSASTDVTGPPFRHASSRRHSVDPHVYSSVWSRRSHVVESVVHLPLPSQKPRWSVV